MIGLHSPFGLLGQIKRERGYTHEYLLWGESWINILLEGADQPRYDPDAAPEERIEWYDGAGDLRKSFGR